MKNQNIILNPKVPIDPSSNTIDRWIPPMYNTGFITNPNLLINSNFFINQRGDTAYKGNGYSVDRWKGLRENQIIFRIPDDGVIVDCHEQFAGIEQLIEIPDKPYIRNLMVSFNIEVIMGNVKSSVIAGRRNSVFGYTDALNSNSSNNIEYSVKLNGYHHKYYSVRFETVNGEYSIFKLKWVKLEFGKTVTQYVTPNMKDEIKSCLQYYIVSR